MIILFLIGGLNANAQTKNSASEIEQKAVTNNRYN